MNKRVKTIMETYRVARKMWDHGVWDDITVDIFAADFLCSMDAKEMKANKRNTKPTTDLMKIILEGFRTGQAAVSSEPAFRKFVEKGLK